MKSAASLVFFLLLFYSPVWAETKCADAEGEAAISAGDIPSARAEALARAKWSAIEQTLGVEVKAQSVVQNMAFVDDAVIKQIRGVVTGFKILREENLGDTYKISINACVEPSKAQDALMAMALNNSIAVFIPARKPKVVSEYESKHGSVLQTRDEYEEANLLSESLIGRLIQQGYQTVDAAPSHAVDASEIDKAMKSGNYMTLRSLMYKFLSNILLVGKIDYTISTRKGTDVGYGLSMPFYNVTTRLTYRIIGRDASGRNVILHSGAEEASAMAISVEDATQKGIAELSEKVTPTILDVLSRHIKGAVKKVAVSVRGVADIGVNFQVKEALQNTVWVTSVEERGLGEFIVGYPENVVYLINSLTQRNFRLIKFTGYSMSLDYIQ